MKFARKEKPKKWTFMPKFLKFFWELNLEQNHFDQKKETF